MSNEEKTLWVVLLWLFSFFTALWLGVSMGCNWEVRIVTSPLIMLPSFFIIALVWWFFRLTFFAGKRSRY